MSQPSSFGGSSPSPAASSVPPIWGALAIVIAALGVAGSLLLSLGMGLRACPLCFYQRSFVMGVLAVLVLGMLADRSCLGLLFLVSAALSVAGLGVASFHVHLVSSGQLECPEGIYGLGDAPTQSLILFALLSLVTLIGAFLGRHESQISVAGPVVAMLLGGAMAYGCVISSPPMPAATPPDGKPLLTCRPVWKGEPAN